MYEYLNVVVVAGISLDLGWERFDAWICKWKVPVSTNPSCAATHQSLPSVIQLIHDEDTTHLLLIRVRDCTKRYRPTDILKTQTVCYLLQVVSDC